VDHNNKVEQVTTKNDKADPKPDEEVEDPDSEQSSRPIIQVSPDAPSFVKLRAEAPSFTDLRPDAPSITEPCPDAPSFTELRPDAPSITELRPDAPSFTNLCPDAPSSVPPPSLSPTAKPFVPSGRVSWKTNKQNAEAANSKTFRWPQQSPMIQNLRDGAAKGAALDDNVVKKLQELGIYRNDGVENTDGDDNNVVDAAKQSGKLVPRNKIRMLFDTFSAHARDGLEKTEDGENLVKIVAYRKKERKQKPKQMTQEKTSKEDIDIIDDWKVVGKSRTWNSVIRKDSLSSYNAIRSN